MAQFLLVASWRVKGSIQSLDGDLVNRAKKIICTVRGKGAPAWLKNNRTSISAHITNQSFEEGSDCVLELPRIPISSALSDPQKQGRSNIFKESGHS